MNVRWVVLAAIVSAARAYSAAGTRCPRRARRHPPTAAAMPTLRDPIVSDLRRLGFGRVCAVRDIGEGGSKRFKYETTHGDAFAKIDTGVRNDAAYAAEALSLRTLGAASLVAGRLRVPTPLAHGDLPLGGAYLLLEWVEQGPSSLLEPSVAAALGEGLAALHTAPQPPGFGRGFGFGADTYLRGNLRQANGWMGSHADFFVERRLRPMLEHAAATLGGPLGAHDTSGAPSLRSLADPAIESAHRLLDAGSALCAPALLHGQLSAKQGMVDAAGSPVLRTPACWYGDPEFDLALGEIDGGFAPEFAEAYRAVRPCQPGHTERMALYELYHRLARLGPAGEGYERVCELLRQVAACA